METLMVAILHSQSPNSGFGWHGAGEWKLHCDVMRGATLWAYEACIALSILVRHAFSQLVPLGFYNVCKLGGGVCGRLLRSLV